MNSTRNSCVIGALAFITLFSSPLYAQHHPSSGHAAVWDGEPNTRLSSDPNNIAGNVIGGAINTGMSALAPLAALKDIPGHHPLNLNPKASGAAALGFIALTNAISVGFQAWKPDATPDEKAAVTFVGTALVAGVLGGPTALAAGAIAATNSVAVDVIDTLFPSKSKGALIGKTVAVGGVSGLIGMGGAWVGAALTGAATPALVPVFFCAAAVGATCYGVSNLIPHLGWSDPPPLVPVKNRDGTISLFPPGTTVDSGVLPGGTGYTRINKPDGSSTITISDGTTITKKPNPDGSTTTTTVGPDGQTSSTFTENPDGTRRPPTRTSDLTPGPGGSSGSPGDGEPGGLIGPAPPPGFGEPGGTGNAEPGGLIGPAPPPGFGGSGGFIGPAPPPGFGGPMGSQPGQPSGPTQPGKTASLTPPGSSPAAPPTSPSSGALPPTQPTKVMSLCFKTPYPTFPYDCTSSDFPANDTVCAPGTKGTLKFGAGSGVVGCPPWNAASDTMLCERPAKGAELDKSTCTPVKCEIKLTNPSDPNSRINDCTPVGAPPTATAAAPATAPSSAAFAKTMPLADTAPGTSSALLGIAPVGEDCGILFQASLAADADIGRYTQLIRAIDEEAKQAELLLAQAFLELQQCRLSHGDNVYSWPSDCINANRAAVSYARARDAAYQRGQQALEGLATAKASLNNLDNQYNACKGRNPDPDPAKKPPTISTGLDPALVPPIGGGLKCHYKSGAQNWSITVYDRPDCPHIAPGVTLTGATPAPPPPDMLEDQPRTPPGTVAGLTPGGLGGFIPGLLGSPLPPFAPPSPGASIPGGGTKCNYSGGISFTVYAGQPCPPVNGQPPISTSSASPPDMKQDPPATPASAPGNVPGSPGATPAATGPACPAQTRSARKCPWTPNGFTVGECTSGFCWDGGPQGSLACKQEKDVPNSKRTYTTDIECAEGHTAKREPCTGVIQSCEPQKAAAPSGLKTVVLPGEPLKQFIPSPPTALGGAPAVSLGLSAITPLAPEPKVIHAKKKKAKAKPQNIGHRRAPPTAPSNAAQEAANQAATAAAIGTLIGVGAAIAGSRVGRSGGGHRRSAPMAPSGHHR